MIQEELFKAIKTQFNSQLPFVGYRHPNDAYLKAILQQDNIIHTVNDFTESGFVFSPFDSKQDAILLPLEQSNTISCEYLFSSEISINQGSSPKRKEFNTSKNGHDYHFKLVEKGIQAIHDGRFEKIVLSRVERVPISEENPIDIFKTLLDTYPAAYVYIWYHPQIGLWLGATPETLLKTEGQRFKTTSLAGTKKHDKRIDTPWGTKEIHEQQIVTDFIVREFL